MRPVFLALPLAACSLVPPPSDRTTEPGLGSWSGTVSLHSSSVPNPYNWTREARVDAERVSLTVSWWATKTSSSATEKSWERTLSADEKAELSKTISALDPAAVKVPEPGACYSIVKLAASGREISLTTAPGDPNYARVNTLWQILAGDGDVTLPEHSFTCPKK